MPTQSDDAVLAADHLLDTMLKSQPALLQLDVRNANENSGKNVAAFIQALRNELIAMYRQTP